MIRIFCCWALLCPLLSFSQTTKTTFLKGIIYSVDKAPLSDASLTLVRSGSRATSDIYGKFNLPISGFPDTLFLSYIGFQSQKIIIRNGSDLLITMEPLLTNIEEVSVSTGYQELSKEKITGSFTKLGTELINRRVTPNILDRLDGMASGLVFNHSNSGDEPISIRGRSTLLGAQAATPLIVLDNFPYEGDIQNINPNDIASITLLKDAGAASIWGARAGNGVIVITTKKGAAEQKPQLDFTASATFTAKPDLFYSRHFLNSSDYIEAEQFLFSKGYYDANLRNATSFPAISPAVEILAQQRAGSISQAEAAAKLNTLAQNDVRNDYQNYLYQAARLQSYALNYRDGSGKFSYTVSGGYDIDQDALIGNGYKRTTLNSTLQFRPLTNLEITAGLGWSVTYTQTPNQWIPGSSNASYYNNYPLYPYAQLRDAQGNNLAVVKDLRGRFVDSIASLGYLDWTIRPLDEIANADIRTALTHLLMKTRMVYRFGSSLKLSFQYQQERQDNHSWNYHGKQTYYTRSLINQYSQRNASTGVFTYPLPAGGILNRSDNSLLADNARLQLDYHRNFRNLHDFSLIAGTEIRQVKTNYSAATLYGYDDNYGTAVTNINYQTALPLFPYGTSKPIPVSGGSITETTNRYLSAFLNAGYTYRDRYTVSLSARKDGANIFGVNINDRFTPLWSAGAAWLLSKEKWYASTWLPKLTIRASYGFNGNVYNASAYLTAKYTTSSLTGAQAAVISAPPNPELRWEKVANTNLGIDFAGRNNNISGSIDLYSKKGTDLIETAPLAPSTGFTSFNGNAAATRTIGLDLQLNTKLLNGPLHWNTSFLFSVLHDKILNFDKQYSALNLVNNYGSLIAVTGKSLFGIYAYPWAGLDPVNGDPQGILNHQASKNYSALVNMPADSLMYFGSARPTIFGSLRNSFSWHDFTFSFNLQFKLGYYFRKSSVSLNYTDLAGSNPNADYHNRWKKPGDEQYTNIPSLSYPSNSNRNNFYTYSETLVEKGDHIRLQDIRLDYTMDQHKYRKLPFRQLSLYVYASNLGLLWKANHSGIDPDANDNFYLNAYPPPFSLSIGLKASL